MSIKATIILVVVALGSIGLTTFVIKENMELKKNLSYVKDQAKDNALQLGKAQRELGDANKKVGELSDELQSTIKSHQEVAKQYTKLEAKYTAANETKTTVENAGTVVTEDAQMAEGHYYFAIDPANKKLIDLGPDVRFSSKDHRIDIHSILTSRVDKQTKFLLPAADIKYILHLKIRARLVDTIDPEGKQQTYAEIYEVDNDEKEVGKFTLTQFTTVTNDERAKHFTLWNPHLDAGIVAGYNGDPMVGGSVGISLMSYGLTKNDMTWRFFRPGVSLSRKVGLDFAPALYNIGEPLPLVSNLWIGPYVSYDFTNLGTGLMLNLVL